MERMGEKEDECEMFTLEICEMSSYLTGLRHHPVRRICPIKIH